ncbi:uncharacterized protein LOC143033061 isoform X2 [Oratosquilla oratoria]
MPTSPTVTTPPPNSYQDIHKRSSAPECSISYFTSWGPGAKQISFFIFRDNLVIVKEMPLEVLSRHSVLKENWSTLDCRFNFYISICRCNSIPFNYAFMFVHECPSRFGTLAMLSPIFYSVVLKHELELDICSSNTRILYRQRKELTDFRNPIFDIFLTEIGREEGDGKQYQQADDFQVSRLIKPFTYLRLRYLNTFKVEQGPVPPLTVDTVNSSALPNQFYFFDQYGAKLRKIIAHLEKHFGVNELTLMNDTAYKWSFHAMLESAIDIMTNEDLSCVDEMTIGKFMVYERDNTRFLTNAIANGTFNFCIRVLRGSFIIDIDDSLYRNCSTFNLFWPFCGNINMLVMRPEPLQSEWFYLTTGCRAVQIVTLFVTTGITFITIGGNIFVLFIIHNYSMYEVTRHGPAFFILRSLAVADLLTGVFPGLLAVWDQFALMTGYLTLPMLDTKGIFTRTNFVSLDEEKWERTPSLRDLRFERQGYPMFCALTLSVTSIVSLLMLFLLSFERYAGVTNKVFPCFQVVGSVWASWVVAIVLGILLFVRNDGFHSAGYFDPISKLTVSTATSDYSLSIGVFYLEVTFVIGTGFIMVFMTFFTFYTFLGYRMDRERLGVILHCPGRSVQKENQIYFTFFFLLVSLYLISCLPLAVNTFGGFTDTIPELQFFAWWFFMAASSWNWYIYTYIRGPFQQNVKIWTIMTKRRIYNRLNMETRLTLEEMAVMGIQINDQKRKVEVGVTKRTLTSRKSLS